MTLRPDQLETAVDYASLRELGASLGSAGCVLLGPEDCPLTIMRYHVAVCAEESCGACPPCRIGTEVALRLLEQIEAGAAEASDLDRLERLCRHMGATSLCEHGRNAPKTVLAGLANFRVLIEEHIATGSCPVSGATAAERG